jgi:hypothetical protein
MKVLNIILLASILFLAGCTSSDINEITGTPQTADVQILTHDGGMSTYFYEITGTAKNIGNKEVNMVQIKARLYDENNTQLGTAFDIASNVLPGTTFNFKITYWSSEDAWKVDHYEVFVDSVY